MTSEELLTQIAAIVSSTFRVPGSAVGPETRQEDIAQWDSLGHIRLFLALEQRLKIKFSLAEIEKMRSVAEIAAVVARRNGHD